MPFQTVPPIDSAEYINSQKAEFETTYYADNLNTLGAGGSAGSSVVAYAKKNVGPTGLTVPDGPFSPIAFGVTDLTLVGSDLTYDFGTNEFTVATAGVYQYWVNANVQGQGAGDFVNVDLDIGDWTLATVPLQTGQYYTFQNTSWADFAEAATFKLVGINAGGSAKFRNDTDISLIIAKIA